MSDGSRMADDFRSGTAAAACDGTTTVLPFACQMKGGSLGEAIDDYHRRAEGKALIDYAFHLIIGDPTEQVMGQELPALIRDGYTSFKIYMTYDDLKLSDREMLAVFALARREGALTMVHAENADCIGWRPPARRRPATTPRRGRRWSSGRPPTGPSPWPKLWDVPILIVHVSGEEAAAQIRAARGTVVVEHGTVVGAEGGGRFLPCELPRPARPGDSRAVS